MGKAVTLEGKKLEIVKWAFDRFYEGGFHATGIDSVMAESGISKRTVYKYFASKEELIEAVLDYYGAGIVRELFDPVMAMGGNAEDRIIALFEIRRSMTDECPVRGCLGMKASQEYVGRHQGIASHGKNAAVYVQQKFVDLCKEAGLAEPTKLGKQLNLLFQGAVLLSQVIGDSSPFVSAKAAAKTLLSTHRKGIAAE